MSLSVLYFFVFFFKQKTAYEMRISDWSSDVCSSDLPGGAARVGPNLYDIVAHPIAAEGGFSYSSGLSDHSGDTWTYENLNHFLPDPRDFAPGTKMTFRGFSKHEDVDNVVAYLRTLSGSKIGRASWRERVCKDVSTQVGGGLVKK